VLFVPMVTPSPTAPGPRARELAELLSTVIREYEKHHPAVTGDEVRQALALASQSSKAAPAVRRVLVATLAGGLAAAAGVAAYVSNASGGGAGVNFRIVAVALGVLLVAGLAIVLKRVGNL